MSGMNGGAASQRDMTSAKVSRARIDMVDSQVTLPTASDWMHRPDAPGYYVTKDGRHQMLLPERGQGYLLCETKADEKGRFKVIKRTQTLDELNIPAAMQDEGDTMMINGMFAQARKARNSAKG